MNHDNVRRHDSTVHYIFCDDVCCHDSSKLVNDDYIIANDVETLYYINCYRKS